LLIDQSGSMVDSVIHSAVMAACLWQLPGMRTRLVAFDTAVVDLTADVSDPVELLMKVQLGGGTDIAKAVGYAQSLIANPGKSIVVLVSDFYEGGSEHELVRRVKALVESGAKVLGLAALDSKAEPNLRPRDGRAAGARGRADRCDDAGPAGRLAGREGAGMSAGIACVPTCWS
jgi:uncharacterized protein with von Willebrand factor type A (vWA) domain